ncbi:SRPBCC family protein [Paenibacillus radicis (ex Xue et al. 2023)]|uniref:SRPBCC family protein n=1 Tax=Paenibacillus radicis (ex Xue et al. 2023) TaxID=2972489 RepID=A0ABT1YRA7_9BACL|nr:SRPBCC family protein [Paenibacillus radicis (ex Xue et al. 2023)]MCR8634828.1 SRPBCC family protein [Paenibacillus radicis (ex Xue et al. 2023)]
MTTGENEIISSREFDVPRELVFRAWTTPELLARWWGPKGFTNTFHEIDIRPGGTWRLTMHGPNGLDYPNLSVFVEIVPLERIVLDHLSGHEFRVTATFEDLNGRTRVTFRQLFKDTAEFEKVKPYCVEGNEQNFDRLGNLLVEMVS